MLKKILATALAAAMILGLASVAFAASFSDTADSPRETAIKRLAGLGLVNGYPDGTFRPDNPITRAEVAKMIVFAMGLKDAAEMLSGVPVGFSDVESNHWATGYISIAATQGIVKGYPDGTFRPQANVTYAEILTMILRALGYGPVLDKGLWPNAYITKAAELKINKGISFNSAAAATRGDVAGLLANAISKAKLVQVSYGDSIRYVVSGTDGTDFVCLLNDMGAEYDDGWLVSAPDLFANDGDEVKLEGKTSRPLAEGVECTGLLGHKVRFWINDEGEVFFVEDITPESAIKAAAYDTATSVEIDDEIVTLADIEDELDVDMFMDYAFAEAVNNLTKDHEITVIYDGDVPKFVIANKYLWGVVETASETYERITFSDYGPGARATLRLADHDVTWIGAAKSFADLEENDVVEYIDGADKAVVIVTRNAVEGEFSKLTSKATVDGVAYDLASGAVDVDPESLGYDVTVLLNKDGEIVKMIKDTTGESSSTVAVVLQEGQSTDGFSSVYKLKLFLSDGTESILEVASTVSFKDEGQTSASEESAGTIVDKSDDTYLEPGDVISYKTNSKGKVSSITVKVPWGSDSSREVDEDRALIGNLKVTSDTVIFNLITKSGGEFGDAEVLTRSEFLAIDAAIDAGVAADGGTAVIVAAVDAPTAESDLMYGMVYGKYRARIDDEVKWIVRILVDGEITDYTSDLDSDDDNDTTEDVSDYPTKTVVGFKVTGDNEISKDDLTDLAFDTPTTLDGKTYEYITSETVYKAIVTDVDLENGLVTVEMQNEDSESDRDPIYLVVDEDTLYYDASGTTPESITLGDVSRDSEVDVYLVDGIVFALVIKK